MNSIQQEYYNKCTVALDGIAVQIQKIRSDVARASAPDGAPVIRRSINLVYGELLSKADPALNEIKKINLQDIRDLIYRRSDLLKELYSLVMQVKSVQPDEPEIVVKMQQYWNKWQRILASIMTYQSQGKIDAANRLIIEEARKLEEIRRFLNDPSLPDLMLEQLKNLKAGKPITGKAPLAEASPTQQKDWRIIQTEDRGVINKRNLNGAFFINRNVGWVYGEGIIFKTLDAGNTWQRIGRKTVFSNYNISHLFFVDENRGWFVCAKPELSVIMGTSDGGETWEHLMVKKKNVSGFFANSGFFHVRSENGMNIKVFGNTMCAESNNGGRIWEGYETGRILGFAPAEPVVFAPRDFEHWVMACGNKDRFLFSNDGGKAWSTDDNVLPRIGGSKIRDICFYGPSFGVAVGDDGYALATRDGGKTWSVQNLKCRFPIAGCHFHNEEYGWATASQFDQSVVLGTLDGGRVWEIYSHFTDRNKGPIILGMPFAVSPETVVIPGNAGRIFIYTGPLKEAEIVSLPYLSNFSRKSLAGWVRPRCHDTEQPRQAFEFVQDGVENVLQVNSDRFIVENDTRPNLILTGNEKWDNYRISARIKFVRANSQSRGRYCIGLLFRVTGNNYFNSLDSVNAYVLIFEWINTTSIKARLFKMYLSSSNLYDPRELPVLEVDVTKKFQMEEWYAVSIECLDDQISCSLEGEPMMRYQDSEAFANGRVGIMAYNGVGNFAEILVESI